ncbi:MAG: hypothetical protein JF565_01975 [Propionibacteriales bacterium]|nr:hypothetical protein [Propionibacteriales bacterium]
MTTKATESTGSLFDFPAPGQDEPTPAEEAQAEAVAEEKPVTSEPPAEIGSGSLFDIAPAAPAEAAPAEEKAAEPDEPEDQADAGDEPAEEKPSEKPAHQPKAGTDIPEGGSLFDL